jgi:DNA segregation ATPase FtsK/SpoIIIE-like protein
MLLGETHWPIDRAPQISDMKHQRYVAANADDSAGFMSASAPWAHTVYRAKNGRAVSVLKLPQAIPATANKSPEYNYAAKCCTRNFQALPYCDWVPLPMSIRPYRAGGAIERLPGVTPLRQPSTALAVAPVRQDAMGGPYLELTARNSRFSDGSGMQDGPRRSDARAEKLLGILRSHGVTATLLDVQSGPVVTVFIIQVPTSVRSKRLLDLSDDIARSMSAVSARVAVIPGRDAIGIELPNEDRQTVELATMLNSREFRSSTAALPLALGVTISGEPVIADLATMPHLLVAGTTGSGKSVGVNAMILSLLNRMTPDQCRFIMIDPKMLELTPYEGIPHLLMPVVTNPHKAIEVLKWVLAEMERRYDNLMKVGARSLGAYNSRLSEADRLPYIVVIIDEFADLMMVAGKDIEFTVQRLAQLARAAGIHVIMATQRPSVDVIVGSIKANMPSRISYQVVSKIDSRTILDDSGAEQLLGKGDLLIRDRGAPPKRLHGPFVSDDEVERIVAELRGHGAPDYVVIGESDIKGEDAPVFDGTGMGMGERDREQGTRRGDRLAQWFIDAMSDGEWHDAASIKSDAKEAGFKSVGALYAMAKGMDVEMEPNGKPGGAMKWRLP